MSCSQTGLRVPTSEQGTRWCTALAPMAGMAAVVMAAYSHAARNRRSRYPGRRGRRQNRRTHPGSGRC
eukprot:scaffold54209_cov57-Phaeocystis_antarctica.AAC.3